MTYTNLPDPQSGQPWQIGIHRLEYADGRFGLNRTSGRVIGPPGRPDKDAVVFNLRGGADRDDPSHPAEHAARAVRLTRRATRPGRRVLGRAHARARLAHDHLPLDGALGVGAGAPPVSTDDGLLLFFHERTAAKQYTLNVALLDDETGRVKAMLPDPIMRPELPWERIGDVDDVVFVQGAIPRPDGTIYLTYGAADRCVGAASVVTSDVLDALRIAA